MKFALVALGLLALVAPAAGLSLTTAAPRSPALAIRRRPVFMAEESPAPAKAEQPKSFAPPPAEQKREFDISQYSMTLSIFVIFVLVKSLAYFGVMDVD
jgi:hypothetical protein